MPHFYRNSRQLLRIFLVLVLAMALFGGWYGAHNWQVTPDTLDFSTVTAEVDWLEVVASLVETGIEVFQGASESQ